MGKRSSKEILDDLRKQIRETGSGLVKLENRERAEKLYEWLQGKLPKDFGVWIIDAPGRENEVNVYRIIDKNNIDSERAPDWLLRRGTKTSGVPKKFKKWKSSRGL